jgi:plastocyanin
MKKLTPTLAICCVAFLAAVVSAGVGWGAGTSAPPAVAADTIAISGFVYSPDPLPVAPGSTVTVENGDGVPHSVSADDATSFTSGILGGGTSGSFLAPAAPGTYTYFCEVHPGDSRMHGTLIVSG